MYDMERRGKGELRGLAAPRLGIHFKTLLDSVLHVGLRLFFRLTLDDTSRNSWALSDVHSILVAREGTRKLHDGFSQVIPNYQPSIPFGDSNAAISA